MNEAPGSQQNKGSADWDKWFAPKRFAIFLAVLIAVAFHEVLLGGQSFLIRDFSLFSYPVAYFAKQSWLRGDIPFWNPLDLCGVPFLAQFNTLALYPLSLIYLVLPLPWALPFFCLLHLYIGGLGMYFLARRWTGSSLGGALAGVVFAFNGLSLSMLMWPSHTAAFALVPWTIFAAEAAWQRGGRCVLLAGITGALLVLAGGPEEIVLASVIILLLAMIELSCRRISVGVIAKRLITTAALALALSAPLWLPFVDFAAHSHRDTHFGGSAWSMPLYGWANFLVPMFRTTQWQSIAVQTGQAWTSSYYAGVGTILLALVALLRRREPRVVVLGILLVLSVVLALGDAGHVYAWMRQVFPFIGMFRYPVKFVLLSIFVLPLLAAYGLSYYETHRVNWRLETICAMTLIALVGVVIWMAKSQTSSDSPWQTTLTNGIWRIVFLIAFVAAIIALWRVPKLRVASAVAIVLLAWLDLVTHEPWQNPVFDASLYQPGLAQMKVNLDPKPALGESRLMMSPFAAQNLYFRSTPNPVSDFLLNRIVFLANLNILDNFPKVDGFFSLSPKEIDHVLRLFDDASPDQLDHLEDLLGVSQTIEKGKVFDWVARKTYLPVVSIGEMPAFGTDADNLSALTNSATDLHHTVYLPAEAKNEIKAGREDGAKILAKNFEENRVSLEVDTPAPTMALITQTYYHDWKAYIDGKPTKLWRADYAFQGVEIPMGKHEVKLVYEDKAFWIGVWIFIGGLIGSIVWWIRQGRPTQYHPS